MSKQTPELSFEFFPPRTDKGVTNLAAAHAELAKFEPEFFSVTFGAGGSTQEGTFDAVKSMIDAGSDTAPHISCVGSSEANIHSMIEAYLEIGVKRLVVLRGDLPSGMVERGDFSYASDLVSFIRREFGSDILIEVAAYPDFHPESRNPKQDLENFKSNYATLVRFSDACGAELPRWIRARLEQYQDDEASLKAFGLDVVTHLCFDLLDNGVPGLHFYALNKVEPTKEICQRVGFQFGQP